MTLKELKIGQSALIKAVGGTGALRQHFLDMGVIPGAEVTVMLKDMNFARISRSVIINFENVNTIGDEIIMTDGVKLKSSRRMKKQIQEDFFNYMCKVARVERADR